MNWPLANFASEVKPIDNGLEVTREIDAGLEKISLDYPCIISCDLRLNTPRYSSLKNITAAKKKPIKEIKAEDLKIDLESLVKVQEVTEPSVRKGGVRVNLV